MTGLLTLLLCEELAGKATPIARINDADLLRAAGAIALRQTRMATRRLEREKSSMVPASRASEQILKGLLGSGRAPRPR